MRWIDRSEHGPRLPVRAVVMSRIVPLRPPICLLDGFGRHWPSGSITPLASALYSGIFICVS
jgi:hypothetical protein